MMMLRKHQSECVETIQSNSFLRGKIILPTGTGKTYVEATLICNDIAYKMSKGEYGGVHVVCNPRILLSLQHIKEIGKFTAQRNLQVYFINVNSGEFRAEELDKIVASYGLQALGVCSTTSFFEIQEKVARAKNLNIPIIMVSTYHSANQIQKAGIEISTWTNDEAHYLVSNGEFSEIPHYASSKMFFFTATPKVTDDEENGKGMQNETLFGKELFLRTPRQMVDAGEMVKPALHLVGLVGQDCSTDLSKDFKAQAAAVIDVFNFHKKAVRDHSISPEKIGAKLVVVCEGQASLMGMLGTPQIKEFQEQNPNVHIYALSSDFGVYISGKGHNKKADNRAKEVLMKELKELNDTDEAIIFHVDMIAEGIDVPGITGIMPFRNMGKIKFLQNLGRASRLFSDDREKLYAGALFPRDFKNYVKPYSWIILPIFLGNSNDCVARYKEYVRYLRSDYGFDSSELVILENQNGFDDFQEFDEVAKIEKEIRGISQELRNFVHQLEDEETLNKVADLLFRTSLCDEGRKTKIINQLFPNGCIEELPEDFEPEKFVDDGTQDCSLIYELNNLNSSGKNGLKNRRDFIKECLLGGQQSIHTPYELCKEIIGKTKENCEKDGKIFEEQDILVLFNTEFIETLIFDFGISPEKISFIGDSLSETCFVGKAYGLPMNIGSNNFENDGRVCYNNTGEPGFLERIVKKFDCVIMNPPFKGQLHLEFFEKALDLAKDDGIVISVHPSTWLFAGSKGQKTQNIYASLKKKISEYQKEFTLFNANKLFGIGMFMPCSITMVEKGKKSETAKVIDKLQDKVFEYKNIWDVNKFGDYPEYYSLLEKISKIAKEDNLENHKHSTEHDKNIVQYNFYINLAAIRGNVSTKNDEVMTTNDFYTFVPKDLKAENQNTKTLYFGFSSYNQADNFLNYIKSNFARFCLSLVKTNGNIHRGEMVLVPYLDFSQEWTDEILKKKFFITEKEWDFIQGIIPNYYE